MKVQKDKFDALLDRLVSSKPLKRNDIKTGPKKKVKVIEEPRTAPQRPSR